MRTGKIARLSPAIRKAVNERIHNGEPARPLLAWLNKMPEVRAVLKREFHGQPINAQNLSEWRKGGYQDWLAREEAFEFVRELNAGDGEEASAPLEDLPDKLAHWVAVRYAAAARRACAATEDPDADWRRLREFLQDVTELQRGHQNSRRLRLDRDRFDESMRHKRREEEHEEARKNGKGGITRETIEKIERELKLL